MKKLIAIFLMLCMIPAVFATERREDKSEPIEDFEVYKLVSDKASNEVVVLTVNSGERGYVVISVTNEDKYSEALNLAREMLKTEPTELFGTKFAYVRARV